LERREPLLKVLWGELCRNMIVAQKTVTRGGRDYLPRKVELCEKILRGENLCTCWLTARCFFRRGKCRKTYRRKNDAHGKKKKEPHLPRIACNRGERKADT